MLRPATLIALIADAVLCVVIGLGTPLLVAVIGWLSTAGWTDTSFTTLLGAAAALWGLALGGGVGIAVPPEAFPQLELAVPFEFVVSVAPLLLTLVIAAFGWRSGVRMHDDLDSEPWLGAAVSTLAFAVAAFVSLQFAPAGALRIDLTGALITGTLIWVASVAIGMRAWEYVPWDRLTSGRLDEYVPMLRGAARTAGGLLVGTTGLAALLLVVALFAGMGRVIGLMQLLQLDVVGAIWMGLVQLAYLPTLLVWAAAWLLGPGVALGEGALANPGGTMVGPLPAVPLLGLVPDDLSPVWWAILAVPVALAAAVALLYRMGAPRADSLPLFERLAVPVLGALFAALGLALAAHLSRGAIGPGRLAEFGPHPGWVLLAAFAIFAVGGITGTLVPLRVVVPAVRTTGQSDSDASTEPEPGAAERTASQRWHSDDRNTVDVGFEFSGGPGWPTAPSADDPDWPDESTWDRDDDADDGSYDDEDSVEAANRDASDADTTAESPERDNGGGRGVDRSRDSADRANSGHRAPHRPLRDLSEVLNRPDEPDIYADLDDGLPKGD